MAKECDIFLDALEEGFVVTTDFMKELSADDDLIFDDFFSGTNQKNNAELYDVTALRHAVSKDRDILKNLSEKALAIRSNQDPKLSALVDAISTIVKQARSDSLNKMDERNKRKILIFSYFEDTVEWIKNHLLEVIPDSDALKIYDGRVVVATGSGKLSSVSRTRAIQGFSPESTGAKGGREADKYDLLIATDVLAEGVNLQQCCHIINFDLPWNPMRLVQRHGRIDRIASPHQKVFLRTIFPADRLDNLLELEMRILKKIALAAASVGVVSPIAGGAEGSQVFTESRIEIEKLLSEDTTLYERGGTVGAAQTGEEYRQTLRKAIDLGSSFKNIPLHSGSGMMSGTQSGIFFCAYIGARTYVRFVNADTTWHVSSKPIIREIGTCLRLIECDVDSEIWYPEFLNYRVFEFWDRAQQDIWDEWMIATDPANLQPKVRPLNLRVANHIREQPLRHVSQDTLSRVLDILESPWPRREEVKLRGWYSDVFQNGGSIDGLVSEILETGIEPVLPPDPLPPIAKDDVQLICWMAVQSMLQR